jgi:hypothetical protein
MPWRFTGVRDMMNVMARIRLATAFRGVRRSGAFLAVFLLFGCPYSSDEPLSDPAAASIDASLAGVWRTGDAEAGEYGFLVIQPFNEHELAACARGDAGEDVDMYRLFVTVIGGERFLNIRELGTDDAEWYFARYEASADRLVLRFIDDALFDSRTFGTQRERREFIGAHLSDPFLYASDGGDPDDMVMERALR